MTRAMARGFVSSLLVTLSLLSCLVAVAAPTPAVDQRLVEAAREQIGITVTYDPSYQRLGYPGGDVEPECGVCTDVVVRAYRRLGFDLQVLVHEDMTAAFSAYPQRWGLTRPDRNIDHRRVPNLATFFARHGESLGTSTQAADFAPGDIVTWRLASGVPHIGIVSDRVNAAGVPLVIHNIGRGAVEEDVLCAYEVTGRYRYPLDGPALENTSRMHQDDL